MTIATRRDTRREMTRRLYAATLIQKQGAMDNFIEYKNLIRRLELTLSNKGVSKEDIITAIHKRVDTGFLAVCNKLIQRYMNIPEHVVVGCKYDIDSSTLQGSYSIGSKSVSLNKKFSISEISKIDDKLAFEWHLNKKLDTMLHEYRHAWQQYTMPSIFDDYVSSSDDYKAYYNHPSEVDARNYAKNNIEAFKNYIVSNVGEVLKMICKVLGLWLKYEKEILDKIKFNKEAGRECFIRTDRALTDRELARMLTREELGSSRPSRRERCRVR